MSQRGTATMIAICTAILVAAALFLASSIIAPVAFALFIIALVWPLQKALQRALPQLLALFITLAVTIVVLLSLASLTLWGFGRAAQWLIANAARFQALYMSGAGWLEGHGLYVAGTFVETFNVSWLIRFFQGVASRVNGMVGFGVVTAIFVMLGLLEVDVIRAKLAGAELGEGGRRLLVASEEIARKFRRYMLVRSVMSAFTGLAIWAFAAAAGLDLAFAWGVIAFVLNYIPFIGPLMATLLPTLFAVAQFESWQMAVAVFAGMNVIQFFSGSYIEPRIAGKALAMSPFIVLLSVFFWAFMWGLPGAFIGVPVMIAVLVLCDQYDGSRWVARLLSGRTPDPA
ncbi:AI-2E family transporter [Ancylobacter amanitiformis]|uniref:PurR-regulated permease PerM n=1 Tax=Ancylobacter amanitiformis TaxID=217069 RepID=A0ABU0LN15_9HYPH|nr:AI-2E family transporter [Ancylobacter amanitiformis]MDQ0510099.1 putative PurR-regulated permease PerM [Ancylobacter amanitiformis]